jgi:hypothetical protein
MRRALYILLYSILTLVVLLGGGAAYVYSQRDAIIAGGVEKLNTQLKTPVSVSTIDLDLFSGFPRIRIVLNDVLIEDPFGGSEALIRAHEVGLGINIWNVLHKEYIVEELVVLTGEVHLKHNSTGDNWDILIATDSSSTNLDLNHFEADGVLISYDDSEEFAHYSALIHSMQSSGQFGTGVDLAISAHLENVFVQLDDTEFLRDAPLRGRAKVHFDEDNWQIISEDLKLAEYPLSLVLNSTGGEISASNMDIPAALKLAPLIELPEDVDLSKLKATWKWAGTYDEWGVDFSTQGTRMTYNGFDVPSVSCKGRWTWAQQPSLVLNSFEIKTKTGALSGNLRMEGTRPLLVTNLNGGSNLSELFELVPTELLSNPMGFWKGESIVIKQAFASWDDLTPVGFPLFEGKIKLTEGSFGLAQSNIVFDKVEADLSADGRNIAIDRCFIKSESNTAVVQGIIYHALEPNGYPNVELRLESPTIDIDPLLFWEFEDSPSDVDEETTFDYNVSLFIDHINLGDFNGTNLRGTVFNRGAWMLGKEMRIEGCDGSMGGNWTLYEEGTNNVFRADLTSKGIQLDQLLASFNSFEIEDLDETNLLGEADVDATVRLTFDQDWNQISSKTRIDGTGTIRQGTLRNYAPLQELSAFIDQGELNRIDFPYLKSDFSVHGDTLILPETKVENSALNLWVNGWQNLETDDIRYSVRLGLKDLALRGKNSNRDLGSWISEAENQNQPYIRLIVGCNLDDVCISLDRERIAKSFKESLKQEKQDLKELFKPTPKEEQKSFQQTPSSGTFELLWPEDTTQLNRVPKNRF